MVHTTDYPDCQPIVLMPTGRLCRFPSLPKAKVFFMEHDYWRLLPTKEYFEDAVEHNKRVREEFRAALTVLVGKERALTWEALEEAAKLFDPWKLSEEAHEQEGKKRKVTARVTKAGMKLSKECLEGGSWEDNKMPKQLVIIINELREAFKDGKWFMEEDVDKVLTRLVGSGGLKTKQPPMRVFKFYRKRLLDEGLLILRADQ